MSNLAKEELKSLLVVKSAEMGIRGASNEEIANAAYSERPDLIDALHKELIVAQLGQMISQGRRRAPRAVNPAQGSFFAEFRVPRQIGIPDPERKTIFKNVEECSYAEIRNYHDSLPKQRNKSSTREQLEKLIQQMETVPGSAELTVGEFWEKQQIEKEEYTA